MEPARIVTKGISGVEHSRSAIIVVVILEGRHHYNLP
jgi:hypothetical protein